FSWRRFRKMILKVFPVLSWLFSYQFREWIWRDLHAGLSVGMFQIPQGLLGVWLTRLPLPNPNIFLSAFSCSLTYVVFGTSHHISVGSFSILNVVATNILKCNLTQTLNDSLYNLSDVAFRKDYMEALALSASLTFLTGIIQLLLGCFCLGFATRYLPKTLIDAYLTAAALHVIVSQITFIFDITFDFHKGPMGIFYNLLHYFLALPKANSTSILLFLLGMAVLHLSKLIQITYKGSPIAFPMELLLIIIIIILSNCFQFHAESSGAVLSMVPQRYLPPTLPDLANLSKVAQHAFFLAVVSYFLLIFVGERYASLHGYSIGRNQELMAVGMCNIFSSFFKSFVVSCAISGTVIQEKTGGMTQLAAAIGASVMLVIALKLGHFFHTIPNDILAAVVVFNMLPFLETFLDVPTLWRQDKYHFVIWIVTFIAVLCLGLDLGLVIAVGFTFLIITIRSHRMKMMVLGQIPTTNIYRSLAHYRAAREIEGIKIFQCCSSISFANMNRFKTYLLHKMEMRAVPLDESERRSPVSESDAAGGGEDVKCSCVCRPSLPPPRVPYMEKLVKQHHTDSESSSSSLNLVHWSKYEGKLSSQNFLVGSDEVATPKLVSRKSEAERRKSGLPSPSALDNSTAWLDEEQPVPPPPPIHTIILDFSMVQFVDVIAAELLFQIIHMFHNIGITVLLAGCHCECPLLFPK
ncbi:S26A8 protein, partial [Turnix velox]|nr:S26A8 protein [Turnix velox]